MLPPFSNVAVLALALLALWTQPALGNCASASAVSIERIRGDSGRPMAEGRPVTVRGVVTGRYPGDEGLDGFYLQQAGSDSQPIGIFVYTPDRRAAAVPRSGDVVVLQARTGRFQGRIQLEWVGSIQRCGRRRPGIARLELPAKPARLRRLRDTLVRVAPPLVVTNNYELERYGVLGLAVGGRLFQTGAEATGGRRAGVVLDDGSHREGPRPIPHLDDAGTRRLGSRIESLEGVLTEAFESWRIHPLAPVRFVAANPRSSSPGRAGAVRAVGFNLQNYFVSRGGRGAATAAGFKRQRERLNEVLRRLDADVLALQEVENNAGAVADLLDALNRDLPEGERYQAAAAGLDRGDAAIRSVLLYRPTRLRPAGVWLDRAAAHDRAPLAASFRDRDGRRLGVVTAHFKSRGGCSRRLDRDRGEGCWARRRREQAEAFVDWLPRLFQAAGHRRFVLLGDLNSYAGEGTIARLITAGLVDLLARYVPADERYTYVYRGRAGTLDHALATPAAARSVRGAAIWHINADEPPFLAERGKGPWRSSDHDPVIVDLDKP